MGRHGADLGGRACTAADVIKQLRGTHDWNHSTIRTLLARLVEKRASSTTSTDRGISTGLPSPANNACARKAARFWRRRLAETLQRCSHTLSQKHRWIGTRLSNSVDCLLGRGIPGRNGNDHAARYPRTGNLAGLLASGGIGPSGRAALALLWGTPVAAVAVSTVGCRPGSVAVRGSSSQSLERVQSGPLESAAERTADRRARGRCHVQAGAAHVRLINRLVRNERGIAASCRLRARVYRHAAECTPGVAVHFLRVRDAIDAVHQGSVRCRLDHADSVVVLAGGLSVLWVEASGNRSSFCVDAFRPAVR